MIVKVQEWSPPGKGMDQEEAHTCKMPLPERFIFFYDDSLPVQEQRRIDVQTEASEIRRDMLTRTQSLLVDKKTNPVKY